MDSILLRTCPRGHAFPPAAGTGWERKIIFLTDGAISHNQTETVFNMVSPRPSSDSAIGNDLTAGGAAPAASAWDAAQRTQVFTLGIGHGVHRPLLDGMASRSVPSSFVAQRTYLPCVRIQIRHMAASYIVLLCD